MKFSIDDSELGNIISAPAIAQAGHGTNFNRIFETCSPDTVRKVL